MQRRSILRAILTAYMAVALVLAGSVSAATTTAVGASFSIRGLITEAFAGLPQGKTVTHDLAFPEYTFGSGTGTGNINLGPYVSSQNLGTSASTTFDLTSYTNNAGTSVTTLTKLKILWIYNTGTVAIDIGGAAATQLIGDGFLKGADDVFTLPAGECLAVISSVGITVSGSAKSLKVLNTSGATAAAYNIFWAGSTT